MPFYSETKKIKYFLTPTPKKGAGVRTVANMVTRRYVRLYLQSVT